MARLPIDMVVNLLNLTIYLLGAAVASRPEGRSASEAWVEFAPDEDGTSPKALL